MKTGRSFIEISLILLSFEALGQTNKIQNIRKIESHLIELNQMFDEDARYHFMRLPEEFATSKLHEKEALWIGKHWGLSENDAIKKHFKRKDIVHIEDILGLILTSYHRYLNQKPIELKKQIKTIRTYYRYAGKGATDDIYMMKNPTERVVDSMMSHYFFPEDAVLVDIYGSKMGKGKEDTSFITASALVKENRGNQILVLISEIKNDHGKPSEWKHGDLYLADRNNCRVRQGKIGTETGKQGDREK